MATQKGNRKDNILTGTNDTDLLFGLGGEDTLNGKSGDDTLIGGKGNDQVQGSKGSDLIIWNEGDGSDAIDGGADNDVVIINYAGEISLRNKSGQAIVERKNKKAFRLEIDSIEQFEINGDQSRDRLTVKPLQGAGVGLVTFSGNGGKDIFDGRKTKTNLIINGGSGRDRLTGGRGDDTISSGKGTDHVNGGAGQDRIIWNEGDGDDLIDAGANIDIVEENFSGDTVLAQSDGSATFGRTGANPFTMTIDNAELFEINGETGDDSLTVIDLFNTDVIAVTFSGNEGNDRLDASATNTRIEAIGGQGNDTLIGGSGTIADSSGEVIGDTLSGGKGKDEFWFASDPFGGNPPTSNLNQPDEITDFKAGQDQFAFDQQTFAINALKFQQNTSSDLSDGNLLVLTDAFASADEAASAIADNEAIVAKEGFFVYFNTTLGVSRIVYSSDLATGGSTSVIANLTNQTEVGSQDDFSKLDFKLV